MEQINQAALEASKYGGKCLRLTNLKDALSIYEWQCGYGHRWLSSLEKIGKGYWCQTCIQGKHRYTLDDMKSFAAAKGGEFLSPASLPVSKPVRWKCKEGHKWEVSFHSIKKGSWCKKCAINATKDTIDMMQDVAKSRDGKCLSTQYVDQKTKLRWQCSLGHTWEAQPANVKMGQWCPHCAHDKLRLTLQEIQQIAKKKGGKCLVVNYKSNTEKILWECELGHQWMAATNNVSMGSWCPECARNQPYTLDDMKALASKHGGACLSKKYINSHTPMKWKCGKVHEFKKAPTKILDRGSWCSICAGVKRHSIEDMQKIAESRKGKCLSKSYINSTTHLTWSCDKSHKWQATPKKIIIGTWCPRCYRESR